MTDEQARRLGELYYQIMLLECEIRNLLHEIEETQGSEEVKDEERDSPL